MKKMVLLLVVGLAISTSALGETTDTVVEKATKPAESKDGGASATVKVEKEFLGGLFKVSGTKEVQKVDGLIAENLHTKCDPSDFKKVCWNTENEVWRQKGKPSRWNVYTEPGDIKNYGKKNRRVFYYESDKQTEVYVFRMSEGQAITVLDDFITSTPNFVATKDRF